MFFLLTRKKEYKRLRKEMYPEEYTVFYICISTRSRGGYQKKNRPGISLSSTLKVKERYYGQDRKGAEQGNVRNCENDNVWDNAKM